MQSAAWCLSGSGRFVYRRPQVWVPHRVCFPAVTPEHSDKPKVLVALVKMFRLFEQSLNQSDATAPPTLHSWNILNTNYTKLETSDISLPIV